MAQNEILQIVVFAVFFAVAMGAMPERSALRFDPGRRRHPLQISNPEKRGCPAFC